MDIKIFTILLILVLMSCNTQKVVERKQQSSVTNTELSKQTEFDSINQEQSSAHHKVDSAMLAQVNFLSRKVVNLEKEIIRFDTSKPADPGTGQPPVLEVIKYRSRETDEVDYKSTLEKFAHIESEFNNLKIELAIYKQLVDSISEVKHSEQTIVKNTTFTWPKLFLLIVILALVKTGFDLILEPVKKWLKRRIR